MVTPAGSQRTIRALCAPALPRRPSRRPTAVTLVFSSPIVEPWHYSRHTCRYNSVPPEEAALTPGASATMRPIDKALVALAGRTPVLTRASLRLIGRAKARGQPRRGPGSLD